MRRSRSGFLYRMTTLFLFMGVFFTGVPGAFCSVRSLDAEFVFCSYYLLSGDEVDERDIEELCFISGNPVYTSFKPSEMFTRQSLREEKNRITKKIDNMRADSHFIWECNDLIKKKGCSQDKSCLVPDYDLLPQPTPFINAQITESGKKIIEKTIDSFIRKNGKEKKVESIHIVITLRSEGTENGYQKRFIAGEDVMLPIRYVMYHPLNVRILDDRAAID